MNGKNADPLYVWLKETAPEDIEDKDSRSFGKMTKALKPFGKAGDINWNFGKFLIDKEGNVHARYSPTYKPEQLGADIVALL